VESARKKGLGLLGMTERVRLLGGECQIQSELDAGTRIFVRLPIPATAGASDIYRWVSP
jgi:signal transduction histidine kinase